MEPARKAWGRLIYMLETYPLYNLKCLLGKGEYCDVRIDESRFCMHHCVFFNTGHTLKMISKRPIKINNKNYDSTMEPYALSNGDLIEFFPDMTLKFEIIDQIGGNQKQVSKCEEQNEETKPEGGDQGDWLLEDITCSICDEIIFQAVATYPCNHHFCGGCLSIWQKKNPKECPNCMSIIEGITKNPLVNNIVEKYLKMHPGATKLPQEKEKLNDANMFYNKPLQQPQQKRGRLSSPKRPNYVVENNAVTQNNRYQPNYPQNQQHQAINIIPPLSINGRVNIQAGNMQPPQQQQPKIIPQAALIQKSFRQQRAELQERPVSIQEKPLALGQLVDQQNKRNAEQENRQPQTARPESIIQPPQKSVVRNSKSIEIDQKGIQHNQSQPKSIIQEQVKKTQQHIKNTLPENSQILSAAQEIPLKQSNINPAVRNQSVNQPIPQKPNSQNQKPLQSPPYQHNAIIWYSHEAVYKRNEYIKVDKQCKTCYDTWNGFTCDINQKHYPCAKCYQMLPEIDPQVQYFWNHFCQICKDRFCSDCSRKCQDTKEFHQIKNFTMQGVVACAQFNSYDRGRLLAFIRKNEPGIIIKYMLSKFIEKGKFYYLERNLNEQLLPDSLICLKCYPGVLGQLILPFFADNQIDNSNMQNCPLGVDCPKQFKDIPHQRSYNHVCLPANKK